MQSLHSETTKQALEEHGTLVWPELRKVTGLADVKIKRGMDILLQQGHLTEGDFRLRHSLPGLRVISDSSDVRDREDF